LIRSVKNVKPGDAIKTELSDGMVQKPSGKYGVHGLIAVVPSRPEDHSSMSLEMWSSVGWIKQEEKRG